MKLIDILCYWLAGALVSFAITHTVWKYEVIQHKAAHYEVNQYGYISFVWHTNTLVTNFYIKP